MANSFEDFESFLKMEPDERHQHIDDLLVGVAEPWLNTADEPMVLAMVGSMRAIMEGASNYAVSRMDGGDEGNGFVGGLFLHSYRQQMNNFQTLAALTDVKRSMS